MNLLTLIPARKGSKGLPGKNIRLINGKPLIAWSIEAAQNAFCVDDIFVSTNCEEIANVARTFGAIVPFLRPDELATDITPTAEVILHFIHQMESIGKSYTHILLLEPTSPLRDADDIDNAFNCLLKNPGATSIVGIGSSESQHPDFCVSLSPEGFIKSSNNFQVIRRQDISPMYYYEGSIYISEIGAFKKYGSFYHSRTLGFIFPKWKSFEIDDIVDFMVVETLLKNKMILKNG